MSIEQTYPAVASIGLHHRTRLRGIELATKGRLIFALVIIAAEFTNLVQFATFISQNNPHTIDFRINASPYALQAFGYLFCAILIELDPSVVRRSFRKAIFRWGLAATAVFTWGMLIRAFNPPGGVEDYEFLRWFLLRLNAIGFILMCVILFEGDSVVTAVKRAIALATLFAAAVNIYEAINPGTFSALGNGRATGFYGDANACGMALVFGCLIGLMSVTSRWREIFVLVVGAGVIVTFSREAMAGFVVVVLTACLGRALATRRVLVVAVAGGLAAFALNLGTFFEGNGILREENLARLSLAVSDTSARDHVDLAQKVLQQFEYAPLLGNGFGTTAYWGEEESHNLYLSFMADHGILGLLLIPALLWALVRRAWDYYAFAGAFLIWCMFNHNLFGNPFGLITLAVMADQPRYLNARYRSVRCPLLGSLAK